MNRALYSTIVYSISLGRSSCNQVCVKQKISPQFNSAIWIAYGWTLILILLLIVVTRHVIWIIVSDFSQHFQLGSHFNTLLNKEGGRDTEGYLEKSWSVIWSRIELSAFQYNYQESLIRSKLFKKNADSGKVNIVGDLGGHFEKCYRNFGTIFNIENWTQISDFLTALMVSSQESCRGPHIGTLVFLF